MKSLGLTIVALIGVFLGGCASQGTMPVATHHDGITGRQTDVMEDNLLEEGAGQYPREVVWLNAMRDTSRRGQQDYYLEVVFMAREDAGYLSIPVGATLVLDVDAQQITLSGLGSENLRKTKDGFVHERAIYAVSAAQLRSIAVAKSVTIKIKGLNGLVERVFNGANTARFRTFVSLYAL